MAKGRRILLAAAIAVVVLGAETPTASTAPPPRSFLSGAHCPTYGGFEICSGQVPSFDEATLDVDVTKPRGGGVRNHPLIVMLHGFANDKHEWESLNDAGDRGDKWHWNSHWFARHGFYVLSYTARGFRTDAPSAAYQPDTPAGTSLSLPNGTIHLKSREFEIRDTQWLAALAADTFPGIDPNRVAVTGGSYGGGESWLQASQPTWDFPNRVSGGALPVLQLQVAVPKYPWTDLSYSLAPNGHPGPGRHSRLGPKGQSRRRAQAQLRERLLCPGDEGRDVRGRDDDDAEPGGTDRHHRLERTRRGRRRSLRRSRRRGSGRQLSSAEG